VRSRPGSEAQIDYGKLGMLCDPATGRRVAVWVFAMILSCSRALFVQPVLRMDQMSWNASHVAAFEFFGGVPARLVPDYVSRHIIGVLCPAVLCARPPEILTGAVPMG
jgi:transposase